MKKILLILVVLVLLLNCKNDGVINVKKKNVATQLFIEKIFIELNINADIKVIKSDKFKGGLIDISFKKPYKIFSDEFQAVLISYISYRIFAESQLDETIGFMYYFDIRKDVQKKIVSYNAKKIDKLNYKKYPNFLKLIEYCSKKFKPGDDFSFNLNIENIHKIVPDITKSDTLFKLLFQLSKSNKPSLNNKADMTFITFFDYNLYLLKREGETMSLLKKEQRKAEIQYIIDFWKITKNRDIYDDVYLIHPATTHQSKLQ